MFRVSFSLLNLLGISYTILISRRRLCFNLTVESRHWTSSELFIFHAWMQYKNCLSTSDVRHFISSDCFSRFCN